MEGSWPPLIDNKDGSVCWTYMRPSRATPTAITSKRSRSRAASTLPADRQETECSLERPPKSTATTGRTETMGGA